MSEIIIKETVNIAMEIKEKDPKPKILSNDAILDFWKWIIGTIVIGITGQIISWNYNKSKLEIERLDADSKLITAASNKFDSSLRVRIDYLNYIKPFISTEGIRERIQQTIQYLSPPIIDAANNALAGDIKIEKDNNNSKINKAADTNIRKDLGTLAATKSKLDSQSSISLYNDSVNTILNALSEKVTILPVDSAAIQKITETYSFATPPIIDDFILTGAPVTQWCKEGYYVEYNNSLRIGINDLNTNTQQIKVNFKDIENNEVKSIPPNVKKSVDITVGQMFTLNHGNYRYQITLNYIGAAGRNPFTKAAYITVATYKK